MTDRSAAGLAVAAADRARRLLAEDPARLAHSAGVVAQAWLLTYGAARAA